LEGWDKTLKIYREFGGHIFEVPRGAEEHLEIRVKIEDENKEIGYNNS
jgi:hypothetical protein